MNEDLKENYFNITCQMCGKDCKNYEMVNVAMVGQEWEWWCYCEDCDIETNHPIKDAI